MPAASPLTDKQAEVLAFIAGFIARERWAPTRREVADHFGWRAVNAADEHIKALVRKGRLQLRAGSRHVARNLLVVEQAQEAGAAVDFPETGTNEA